jgi:hypothetical protein
MFMKIGTLFMPLETSYLIPAIRSYNQYRLRAGSSEFDSWQRLAGSVLSS